MVPLDLIFLPVHCKYLITALIFVMSDCQTRLIAAMIVFILLKVGPVGWPKLEQGKIVTNLISAT